MPYCLVQKYLLKELPRVLCSPPKRPVAVVLPVALPLLLLPPPCLLCLIGVHKVSIPIHLTVACNKKHHPHTAEANTQ